MKQRGTFIYHVDDCMCTMVDNYCNRGDHVWSCCGACKKDSECSYPHLHPTYWDHPKFIQTIESYDDNQKPLFKSNKEIQSISSKSFIKE